MLVGILTAAILARLLSTAEYGSYRQVFLLYGTLSSALSLGLPQALYYFLPRSPEESRSILSANLFPVVAIGGCVILILWGGGAKFIAGQFNNPELQGLLYLFSPYVLFALPMLAINTCLVSRGRAQLVVLYTVTSRVLLLVGAVLPVLLVSTAAGAVGGAMLATAVASGVGIVIVYRICREGGWLPRWPQIREQVQYSVPIALAGMMGSFAVNLDKLLVSWFFTPSDLAVYANGAMELPLISVVTGSVTSVLLPEFSALFQRGDREGVLAIWHRAMVKCATILFPVAVFCFAMAPEVIRILFSAKYNNSVAPFRIYLLTTPLRMTSYGMIPLASGRTHVVLLVEAVSSLLQILLSILLMRRMGPIGAAIAIVLTLYGGVFFGFLNWTRRYLETSWANLLPWRNLGMVLAASLIAGCVFGLMPVLPNGDILRILIIGMIYCSVAIYVLSRWRLIDVPAIIDKVRKRSHIATASV